MIFLVVVIARVPPGESKQEMASQQLRCISS